MIASRALLILAATITAASMPSRPSAATRPGIVLEPAGPGRWRATYDIGAPIRSLHFSRAAAFHRERIWKVATPGYRWVRRDGGQALELEAGATPRTVIDLEFPEFTDVLPKEYEFFQPFTDGSRAIFTGHLYATPTTKTGVVAALRTVRIVPPGGDAVVVRGHAWGGAATFTDPAGDGTYAYVGSAKPIETRSLVAIVDPGMPAWLREQFNRTLPRLFAAYTELFGTPLPWKPVVLYSFHDTTSSGYSSGGGTLTGLISMTLTGAAWEQENTEAAAQAFQLLAHEAAHLWNGQLTTSVGDSAAWMHEGSADALANDMLLRFGVIDVTRHRANAELALNQCASALADGSVHSAARRGAFGTFYDCGFVMALWSGGAVSQAGIAAGLDRFWHDLVATAVANGHRYDESQYFTVLQAEGVSPAVTGRMQSFLADTSIESAVEGLRAAGIAVTRGIVPPPQRLQQQYARAALVHLMVSACSRVDLAWGIPARTGAVSGCAPFAEPLRVFEVAGYRLRDQGAQVHDAVRERCAAAGLVTLHAGDGTTIASVRCSRPLAARPPWFALPLDARHDE